MSVTTSICGLRRLLATCIAICGLALVFNAPAFGNACDSNGKGKHNGYECDDAAPPPPPPPPPATPPPPPTGGTPEAPAGDPEPPVSEAPTPAAEEAPKTPVPTESAPPETAPPATPEPGPAVAPEPAPAAAPGPPQSPEPVDAPPPAPSAPPPAEIDGWGPVGSAEEPAPPRATSGAAGARFASAGSRPNASWADRRPDASWNNSLSDYGVSGTSAIITIRRAHGVFGGLSFRVQIEPGKSSFVFRAARSVIAEVGGRLYRVRTWLRTDAPGLTVCLRIQEVAPADPLTSVRSSESCATPTATWKHFEVYRKTLARGNRLVFSLYSYGAVSGDSFEVDNFTVHRRAGTRLWKRVAAAFTTPL